MKYQLHHQFEDGSTKMVMEFEITKSYKLQDAVNEGNEKYPLPRNATWLLANENADEFVKAVTA